MQCYNCNAKRLQYDKKKDAYTCLNCGYEYPKQYFFISHSHLDIEKVRIIRNIIEETFFYEPILFFLKCLSDENELQDLIQREIYERIWFVYCKSDNAEKSIYVQSERQYLKDLIDNGKKINYVEVELDKFNIWNNKCLNYLRNQISHQIRKTKLFISYSNYDREFASALRQGLLIKGYSALDCANLESDSNWSTSVKDHMKRHSYKDGAIILLISKHSLKSDTFKEEAEFALKQNALILPVIIDDRIYAENELYYEMPNLANVLSVFARPNDIEQTCIAIINNLKEL
ncbi:MAG: toll/interleukin-1 receptor domain-containing protein [Clostridia bacterium]|nr:toll/interleukin-1 receptor domain-containing protein [Clostridia bacterium]